MKNCENRHKWPRPKADTALYNSIQQTGFKSYPERQKNFVQLHHENKNKVVNYRPLMLDIENVSRCNYRCTMCQMSRWPGGKRADDMKFEDFQALVDSLPELTEIKLQGVGEPLLAGKNFFKMIRYARDKHLWVRSTTNASLLHINDNYKHLIDSDICELQISIDGTTPQTYEEIRRGGSFKRVSENCVNLHKYCQSIRKMRTRMWVVVQRQNFAEVEEFPALAARLGFERLTLSIDLNGWGQKKWHEYNSKANIHNDFSEEHAENLFRIGQQHGVEVTFWSIDKKYDHTSPKTICPWPFQRVFISSDMRVVPCCMMANPEVMDLGDARQFTEVWNGKKIQEFRQRHLAGDIPVPCQSCYTSGTK